MSKQQQKVLFVAVRKLMRPLVRILLRNGVAFGAWLMQSGSVMSMSRLRISRRKEKTDRFTGVCADGADAQGS
jgi:hypothetical protein